MDWGVEILLNKQEEKFKTIGRILFKTNNMKMINLYTEDVK